MIYCTYLPIELYQILKLEGLASSGGEAKQFISNGDVTLNDNVETRKRKKVFADDIILFNGISYIVKEENNE